MQHFFIQRFGKTHIVMSRVDTFPSNVADGRCGKITRMAETQYGDIFPSFNFLPLPMGISCMGLRQSGMTPSPLG